MNRFFSWAVLALCVLLPHLSSAQEVRIKDMTTLEGAVPVRLVGYGLVVGLDGTGDRSLGGVMGSPHTVRSIASVLRKFDVVIPEEQMRVRNVAAVLVTAELSPFARSGSRFDVRVSSVGDATSLKGGVLWMTPLVADVSGEVLATAQGALVSGDEAAERRFAHRREDASMRVPAGGALEAGLPSLELPSTFRLALRDPDLTNAARIAAVINERFGDGAAKVVDPGAVALTPPQDAGSAYEFLASVETLAIDADAPGSIHLDARTGAVATGGSVRVGPASVSVGGMVLTIGATPSDPDAPLPASAGNAPSSVSMASGSTVQDVVAALRAGGANGRDIASVLTALRDAGALRATLTIR